MNNDETMSRFPVSRSIFEPVTFWVRNRDVEN